MLNRKKELLVAIIVYFITMTILLIAIYKFLENWQFSTFNFFIGGVLVLIVGMGWAYILSLLIFTPSRQIEDNLTILTNNIIHELNIPLSTIQANTNMLKKNIVDEKSLKRLHRIEDASLRLKRLYDELVYSIHREIHEIEKEIFDIEDVIKNRVTIFEEQKRNFFKLTLESYCIKADKIGFEQTIDNLIINAMKYSFKKSPIEIVLNDNILCIKDYGIGMSTSELLRVYERYFQGDTNKTGEGIGLTLVKVYYDSENIDINIKSQKNIGTSVCLSLSKAHSLSCL